MTKVGKRNKELLNLTTMTQGGGQAYRFRAKVGEIIKNNLKGN
jgi:hypothetical protein